MVNYTIKLQHIQCYLPDESTDEVYLIFENQKIWPKGKKYFSMKEGVSTDIHVEKVVAKGAQIKIELWEFDNLSPDDKLGEFILEADRIGGPFTSDMMKKDKGKSKYALTWEVG